MSRASHARHPIRETVAALSLFLSTPGLACVVLFAHNHLCLWSGVGVCIAFWAYAIGELVRLS